MPNYAATGRGSRFRGRDSDDDEQSDGEEAYDRGIALDVARQARIDKAMGKGKAKVQATKTKGKRKKQVASDDEDDQDQRDDDDDDNEDDGEEGAGGKNKGRSRLSDSDKSELVRQITRHILFTEYNRKLHARADIVKAVLPDGKGRYFNELIPAVQRNLRKNCGMELVSLRPKETSSSKNPAKVYALRSTLPLPLIRAAATRTYSDLSTFVDQDLAESSALARELATFAEDDEDAETLGGYLRDVKKEEGAAFGILGVLLALIMVNGKVLRDDQLVSYLRRLSLFPSTVIPLSPASAHPTALTLSACILLLCKQGYIERGASTSAPGAAAARAGHVPSTQRTIRGSGAAAVEGGDPAIEYRWGARSEVEIGELGIARFIKVIFDSKPPNQAEQEDDDDDGEAGANGARANGKKADTPKEKKRRDERFFLELKRAAGSELVDADEIAVSL